MKDWILYEDTSGKTRLCQRSRRDPYNRESACWEYLTLCTRNRGARQWVRIECPEYQILDPTSPEFRHQTKAAAVAILLQANRKNRNG